MDCPYKVFDPCGVPVMSAPEECRYPRDLEREMLEAGYTIRLHGRKITKKELNAPPREESEYGISNAENRRPVSLLRAAH